MRFLSKFFSKDSIFHQKPNSFLLFDSHYSRESHFSTHSKSSKKHLSSPKASKSKRTSLKRSSSPSLYHKITQIISPDEATVNASSSEALRLFDPEVQKCSQGACFNAQEKENFEIDERKIDGSSVSDVVSKENSVVEDVSPVVHRMTQVVRAEPSGVRMEECLDELRLSVSPEIVEKVLKRCFKVGHLALRFFYWVKGQPGFRHTTETYNVMLCIAGEGKEFDLMEKLVREMDEELCLKNVKTWTILVSSYGNANKFGRALWAFDQMRKSGCCPDKGVYEALLHALLNARKVELAVEFYKEMVLQNLRIDRKLYEKLMTCLSMSGHMDEVRLVWNDMLKFSQVPIGEVYTCVLRSFCIAGKVEEAQEVFEEIKKEYPSVQSNAYEILVKGLCRVGNMTDAVKLVDDMKHSSVVDSKVYGCLIYGFLRENDSQKAMELLHCSRKSGTPPAVSSYTQMIQHLFRSDEYQKACELYDEMLEDGIEPDVVAMTAMVAGHVQNHCISKAWEVFESMKQKVIQPSWKAYTVFIKELCKASEPNEAVKLLNEMYESNIKASEDIVHLVECSLTRKGDVEKAKEVRRMFRSCKPHVQDEHCVFVTHEVSNNFAEPHVLTVQTSNDYAECSDSDVDYVCKIISSSIDWSSMQEALEKSAIQFTPELVRVVLQNCQMHGFAALNFFAWVGNQEGYRHNTETFNMAIKIAGSGKDFIHMRSLYREMKRRGCTITPNTWTIMISQYGQAGLTEISLKTYKEMKIEGHRPNGGTYKFLIVFLCGKKGRNVEEAIKIFQEMINAGYMPDREMLGIYLSSLCESGKLEHARKAVKLLCKQGFMPQLGCSLLIKSMCRAGKLEEALKLADEMEHLGCKMDQYIYGSIVHALLRSGNLDKALNKLEEMKRAGIPQSVHINTSLIVHFCKEKQIEKAIDIFKKIIEDGFEPTIVTYSSIIRGYMNVGMVSDAWCVFWRMKLKGPCPDFETYSMFITCLCKSGRSEEGLQLLHEMLQNGIVPSAVNFRTVFHGLNREGKANLAHNVLQTKWFLNRNRKFLI